MDIEFLHIQEHLIGRIYDSISMITRTNYMKIINIICIPEPFDVFQK